MAEGPPRRLSLVALPGLPLVEPGDDLVGLIGAGMESLGERFLDGDSLVIAQKVVSKAEGRYAELSGIEPSPQALELASEVDKDPRLVEIILRESTEVVRYRRGVLVVAHRLGFVLANAGVDHSNIERSDGRVLLLPFDPDASAQQLRAEIRRRWRVDVAVVINDSLGRAWRNGTVGVALGVAGLEPLEDLRGRQDLFGRDLRVTEVAVADELAAAASLVMGQADEGTPVVWVRGLGSRGSARPASVLIRPREDDLFR